MWSCSRVAGASGCREPCASGDRRRDPISAGGEFVIPLTHLAGMTEYRVGELERKRSWIGICEYVLPVEDVLTQVAVPTSMAQRKCRTAEAHWCRVRVGVERSLAVPLIAGPPAHCDFLSVHGIAHDEICRWRFGR